MPKEELLQLDGQVVDVLPNAMFRVKLENGHVLLATINGRMRKNNINVSMNDRVTVEISPYDLNKGRITYRRRG
jgi:translation initiation factor IF-1